MTIERSDPTVPVPDLSDSTFGVGCDVAESGEEYLLDRAYTTWRAAEREAQRALDAWLGVAPGTPAGRHRAYLRALEREEAAARALQRLHEPASSAVSDPATSG